jgi:hypothetical protein
MTNNIEKKSDMSLTHLKRISLIYATIALLSMIYIIILIFTEGWGQHLTLPTFVAEVGFMGLLIGFSENFNHHQYEPLISDKSAFRLLIAITIFIFILGLIHLTISVLVGIFIIIFLIFSWIYLDRVKGKK